MVLPEGKAKTGIGDDNMIQQQQGQEDLLAQLMKERMDTFRRRRFFSFGNIANTFRMLKTMATHPEGKKFFTCWEMGRYDNSGLPLHKKDRDTIIEKAVNAGWMKEIVMPPNLENKKKNRYSLDVQHIINDVTIDKSPKSMRNLKYYTLTDEGKRIYKNLKEILDVLQ